MPRIYSARFIYLTATAAPAGEVNISNVFRDILPDKAFKLCSIKSMMRPENANTHEIQILKNIGAPGGPTGGAPPVVNHGLVYQHVTIATGWHNESVEITEPVDFDSDDSLTIRIVWGAQAAATEAAFEIILRVIVGK